MKQLLVVSLCALLVLPGCATARVSSNRIGPPPPVSQPEHRIDPKVMADYIRQLPIGARVRVSRTSGQAFRATLMKRDADPIVVQRRTRIPEAPIEIPVAEILSLEPEPANGHAGRTAAIGAATAVGATLGALLLLAAIFSD